MSDAKHLLVVYHSKTGRAEDMAAAVIEGARAGASSDVEIRVRPALEADADDLRWCHGVILGTPENFGYMSGALKHFFDRTFYEVEGETEGLPWALFVKAGNDGTGAVTAVKRIVTGLRWREVQPPIVVAGDVREEDLERCRDLGAAFVAGLSLGIF